MTEQHVIVVGAGLAGLSCARHLSEAGLRVTVLESAEEVGGRVRTERVEGFLLDRGFQVLLTSYPEAQQHLDFEALHLKSFQPGAMVRVDNAWHLFADPWRRPQSILSTLTAPVGDLSDKWRIRRLKQRACQGDLQSIEARSEQTTLSVLEEAGLSSSIIDRFFRPFLGGVFLESDLRTSSRMFDFVFRMFATGEAALPEAGMQAIPRQLADRLPSGAIRFNCQVKQVAANHVVLDSGERLEAQAVVVATEGPSQARLLGETPNAHGRGVHCLYFAADRAPITAPILLLNGTGQGPINNMSFPSQIAPSYAPQGQTLVSISVLDAKAEGMTSEGLEAAVLEQLVEWFGADVHAWRLLKNWHIPYALPETSPTHLEPLHKEPLHPSGVFRCGDIRDTASIQGAMVSGRLAAEAVHHRMPVGAI